MTTSINKLTLRPVAYPIFGLKVDAYLVDLAFSLMWGIIIGTLVTLFVIPLLFKFFVKQWSATVSVAAKSEVDKA